MNEFNEEIKRASCSVWVGGDEVNDYYLSYDEALDLAGEYLEDDYDDVVIDVTFHVVYDDINNKWVVE